MSVLALFHFDKEGDLYHDMMGNTTPVVEGTLPAVIPALLTKALYSEDLQQTKTFAFTLDNSAHLAEMAIEMLVAFKDVDANAGDVSRVRIVASTGSHVHATLELDRYQNVDDNEQHIDIKVDEFLTIPYPGIAADDVFTVRLMMEKKGTTYYAANADNHKTFFDAQLPIDLSTHDDVTFTIEMVGPDAAREVVVAEVRVVDAAEVPSQVRITKPFEPLTVVEPDVPELITGGSFELREGPITLTELKNSGFNLDNIDATNINSIRLGDDEVWTFFDSLKGLEVPIDTSYTISFWLNLERATGSSYNILSLNGGKVAVSLNNDIISVVVDGHEQMEAPILELTNRIEFALQHDIHHNEYVLYLDGIECDVLEGEMAKLILPSLDDVGLTFVGGADIGIKDVKIYKGLLHDIGYAAGEDEHAIDVPEATTFYQVATSTFSEPEGGSIDDLEVITAAITQIQAETIDVQYDANLIPPAYAAITQIQAETISVTFGPAPIVASYITQLRNARLIGQLKSAPEPRHIITQALPTEMKPIYVDPVPFVLGAKAQKIVETEPADWIRINGMYNTIVRQEFSESRTNVHLVVNQVLAQLELPADPPTRQVGVVSQYSVGVEYTVADLLRSDTRIQAIDAKYSTVDAYESPEAARSATQSLKASTIAAITQLMRDPETILAGIVSNATDAKIAVIDADIKDPDSYRSETATLTLDSKVSSIETLQDPLDGRSTSQSHVLDSKVSSIEEYRDLESIRSNTNALQATGAVSTSLVMGNFEDLNSTTIDLLTITAYSTADDVADPSLMHSKLNDHISTSSYATSIVLRDPATLVSTAQAHEVQEVASFSATYRNPDDIESMPINIATFEVSSTALDMLDVNVVQSNTSGYMTSHLTSVVLDMLDVNVVQSNTSGYMTSHLTSVVLDMQDPELMGVGTQGIMLSEVVTISENLDAPSALRSATEALMSSSITALLTEYINPDWLYEFPANAMSVSEVYSVPEQYDNPNAQVGHWAPIVNINYTWKAS